MNIIERLKVLGDVEVPLSVVVLVVAVTIMITSSPKEVRYVIESAVKSQ